MDTTNSILLAKSYSKKSQLHLDDNEASEDTASKTDNQYTNQFFKQAMTKKNSTKRSAETFERNVDK